MGDYLAYSLPPGIFALCVFVSTLAMFLAGYVSTKARRSSADETFGIIQTGVAALVAFMLATTFSQTSQRFDQRRALLRDETNAIGTTNLRAAYLPDHTSSGFRKLLRQYAQARLDSYKSDVGTPSHARDVDLSKRFGEELWSMASAAGHAQPANVQLGWLTQSLNEMLDLGVSQDIALRSHVPGTIFSLMVLLMCASAFTTGLAFGRAGKVDVGISLTLLFLLTAVVFTIDDLDRPQKGLIRIDLSPLQQQIREIPAAFVQDRSSAEPA